jgi:PPM family protein phosphatase
MRKADPSEKSGRSESYPFSSASDFPPASATVGVTFGTCSRIGRAQQVNSDHYLIVELGRHQETIRTSLPADVIGKRFDEYGYGMVVADGLGGPPHNEEASRLALVTLMNLILHFGKWNLRVDSRVAQEILDRAEGFYRHVDSTVMFEGVSRNVGRLETTLTAVFGAGKDLFFAHVGHSRAYLFRQGQLMRLTRDHTIEGHRSTKVPVAPLVDVNLTARDLRHILTDTIGMGGPSGPMIDLERFQLADRDSILLCTNGLSDMVEEPVLADVLASGRSPDEQCHTLVDLAMAAGGHDDATALVAQYHFPD